MATIAAIIGDESFEIFRFINPCQARDPELPSWAVDFSALDRGAQVPRSAFPVHKAHDRRRLRLAKNVSWSNDIRELCISGFQWDTVSTIYQLPTPYYAVSDDTIPEDLATLLAETLSKSVAEMASAQDCGDNQRSSKGDSNYVPGPVDGSLYRRLLGQESISAALKVAFNTWNKTHSSIDFEYRFFQDSETWPENAGRSICRYAADTSGTTVLFTGKRGSIGLGPANILPGDSLVLAPGGKCPVILRPEGQHFNFVALSYVHGTGDRTFQGEIKDSLFQRHEPDCVFRII